MCIRDRCGSYRVVRWSIFGRTVDISPFAALRFADTRSSEIDRCISLPYDQFGDEGRDERYRRHPHNVVRLIKPRPAEQPAHEVARQTLASWRRDAVLVADERPAIYPYRQRFVRAGSGDSTERWAFICRLRLTPFESGPVKPHERTYPGTVGERSRLREIVGGLESHAPRLYHVGGRPAQRSTLADANACRPSEVFAEPFAEMVPRARRGLPRKSGEAPDPNDSTPRRRGGQGGGRGGLRVRPAPRRRSLHRLHRVS